MSTPTEQIEAAEQSWVEIYLRNDADDLVELLAEDFSSTSAVGEQVGRDQYLVNLRDEVVQMAYIRPQNLRIRLYGSQTAVVTGTRNVSERYRDTTSEGAFRILRVWVYGQGRWRAAAFQVTAVAPSSPDTA